MQESDPLFLHGPSEPEQPLVLDSPHSGRELPADFGTVLSELDLRNAEAVGRIVASLPQQVILLTHHLDLLKGFDRVLVFDAGHLVDDDAPAAAIAAYRDRMR